MARTRHSNSFAAFRSVCCETLRKAPLRSCFVSTAFRTHAAEYRTLCGVSHTHRLHRGRDRRSVPPAEALQRLRRVAGPQEPAAPADPVSITSIPHPPRSRPRPYVPPRLKPASSRDEFRSICVCLRLPCPLPPVSRSLSLHVNRCVHVRRPTHYVCMYVCMYACMHVMCV